jgi:hypothetical protein
LAGKHKGLPFEHVVDTDRRYCVWILGSEALPARLVSFRRFLLTRYGGIMPFGRYQHRFFSEIVEESAEYCVWASLLQSPSDAMLRFQQYLKHSAEAPPLSKKPRVTPEEDDDQQTEGPDCKVCYARKVNCVFTGCGHLVCCVTCAARCDRCPICRVPVRVGDIIRTYAS